MRTLRTASNASKREGGVEVCMHVEEKGRIVSKVVDRHLRSI